MSLGLLADNTIGCETVEAMNFKNSTVGDVPLLYWMCCFESLARGNYFPAIFLMASNALSLYIYRTG